MNNISIANETIKITSDGFYELNGQKVSLLSEDPKQVKIISPKEGELLLNTDISQFQRDKLCSIEVTCESSFQAAARLDHPLVMNFANAHNPGGGFRMGANAQEEALCRCSTLYASITSQESKEMYHYNNTHPSFVESDYMLISPDVTVFRGDEYSLLEKPYLVDVVTVPAPNRYGAAFLASKELVNKTILRRIRIFLRYAAIKGINDLVLGAWGCGAFGNDPTKVAQQFRTALIDDGLGLCFERVVFAIYGKPDGKNISAFREVFK
ncbi:TIGR02452 family protein [Ruminococcus sp.]|uniref:TIGR02452 family protein n=1 Tax=Ruminococcus sp. TaxID=41978 RepID=UPI0025FEF9DD|nr:TIGR02452 family protein [Ruminococcus sp.]MBQ8966447.1 TIGR02452 family protein [Ruminococcus sp.]